MKKIILSVILIIVLTGCTCDIKTEMKNNGEIKENVLISQNVSTNASDIVNNYIDIYKDELNNKNYDYSNNSNNNNISSALISKEYEDFCSYFNNSIFLKDEISNLSCSKNDDVYRVYFRVDKKTCEEDCLESNSYDYASFSIKVNGNVISSNADNISNKLHTWNFGNSSSKEVILEVKVNSVKQKIYNNKITVIIGIMLIGLLSFILILVIKYKKNRIEI